MWDNEEYTCESKYRMSEEELQQQMIRAREEAERRERTLERDIKIGAEKFMRLREEKLQLIEENLCLNEKYVCLIEERISLIEEQASLIEENTQLSLECWNLKKAIAYKEIQKLLEAKESLDISYKKVLDILEYVEQSKVDT